jgi:hypothetical protein
MTVDQIIALTGHVAWPVAAIIGLLGHRMQATSRKGMEGLNPMTRIAELDAADEKFALELLHRYEIAAATIPTKAHGRGYRPVIEYVK